MADAAVEHAGKLGDRPRGVRLDADAETQHRGVAEPEGETGDEADLRHLDGVEPVSGIDAVAHRTAGEHGGADIVPDRIAGEGAERGDAVGNFGAADGAQRKPVVEGQGEIGGRHEQAGGGDAVRRGAFDRGEHLVDIDIVQDVEQHHHRDGDDGEAEQHADAVPADRVLEKSRHRAQPIEHSSSGPARGAPGRAPPIPRAPYRRDATQ